MLLRNAREINGDVAILICTEASPFLADRGLFFSSTSGEMPSVSQQFLSRHVHLKSNSQI